MRRKAFVAFASFVLALTVTTAFAQSRGRAIASFPFSGSTVSGIVSGVSGNLVSLAGGLVTIDISHANVTGTISAGSLIFAMLSSSNVAPGAPLPASMVAVTRIPDITLTGPVQAVDTANATLTVLGQTIHIDSNTSFGGQNVHGLGDIVTSDLVALDAEVTTGVLTATRVLVFAPVLRLPVLIHGTVKSIGTTSWVITDNHGKDVTVVINAQTKIIGSPKVGDTVDVLANVDSANNYVAISIIAEIPLPQLHLSGVVKSIGPTQWVIGPAVGMGPDFLVQVNAKTKIFGNPQLGDHDDVVVQLGTIPFIAISITKT